MLNVNANKSLQLFQKLNTFNNLCNLRVKTKYDQNIQIIHAAETGSKFLIHSHFTPHSKMAVKPPAPPSVMDESNNNFYSKISKYILKKSGTVHNRSDK